ncbi:MAG: hypothetical protein ACK559_13390, partial [bacterium]
MGPTFAAPAPGFPLPPPAMLIRRPDALPSADGSRASGIDAALRAWRAQRLGATALLRELVGHDRWELPVTEGAARAVRAAHAAPEPWLYED